MEITCRRQDQERFRALGFVAQANENTEDAMITMVDAEANYAHSGELPTDIPYHGFNGPGDNYGDGAVACDGRRLAEVETGHDGGFVVAWNEAKGRPSAESLKRIRRYIAVRKRAEALFAALAKPPTNQPT